MQHSFSALVRFPVSAYFEFNAAMNGIATIDSITRESNGEEYSAHIGFSTETISACISAVAAHGRVIEITDDKESETVPASVRSYVKKGKRRNGVKQNGLKQIAVKQKAKAKTTKHNELVGLITGNWKSVKQLEKLTGAKSTSIHSRFTALRKAGKLQSKNGAGGKMVYRLAA